MTEQQADYKVGWTVTELAEKAGVSTQYIRQIIAKGDLPATKKSYGWLIPDSVVKDWLEKRANKK